MLANERVAEALPTRFGVKDTFNCSVWPAAMVRGKETAGKKNCELLLAAEEMVTLPPVAPRVTACVPVAPIGTLPKFSALGEMVKTPVVETVPVPFSGRFSAGPEMRTLPPATPAVWGVNETFIVTF